MNHNRPGSVELHTLSTFRYEKLVIESKLAKACSDHMVEYYTTVRDYMDARIRDIESRL